MWRENCLQLSNWDHDTQSKEEEIALLKVKVSELEKRLRDALGGSTTTTTTVVPSTSTAVPSTSTALPSTSTVIPWTSTIVPSTCSAVSRSVRIGKAPPIDSFQGDSYEILLDDWLLRKSG